VREDPRNPDVLWLGTEFGVFWSSNGGRNWVELRGGLPTVAVNDLVIHPRDNDLVLATHSRGIWILDQVNALQEMNADVAGKASHLFSVEPAEQVRYRGERAHTGNMIFEGENPPAAAILDYWLRDAGTEVTLSVHDARGRQVATVRGTNQRGINRAHWNLRHAVPGLETASGQQGGFGPRVQGPLVVPGIYTVRLTAGGATTEQVVRVKDDPRLADMDPLLRARWTEDLMAITTDLAQAQTTGREVTQTVRRLEAREARGSRADEAKVRDLDREFGELASRLSRLRGSVEEWTGPMTADQASQKVFLNEMLQTLSREWQAVRGRIR